MKAELISIGDELLIGQVVNTNASWMAVELNKVGIRVVRITARADIILMTGGLGPTRDDITKHTLAGYFGSRLVFHEPSYQQVEKLFKARNYTISDVNRKQAEIPDNCKPLLNVHGTAPGMWFEKNDKVYVSMPGVPYEMKALMTDHILPRLEKRFHLENFIHKTIMTFGMGESRLAEKIEDIENALPKHIKLAYLPQPGIVRIRLSAAGSEKARIMEQLESIADQIEQKVPGLVFGYDDITMEETVGKSLLWNKATLSTAESCTGGYLAHLVTSIPGSSAYFKGSVIAYANEVKVSELGVSEQSLDDLGAVSKDVVEQMAVGGRLRMKSDYCLATSGIAGPDGGTADKPVGTVWIAIAGPDGVNSKLLHLGEHRGRNIRMSALWALNLLRKELLDEK
ncbi:MAG: CinA family nicotinamide mononucleotide deamidase-related protein [bacterium]